MSPSSRDPRIAKLTEGAPPEVALFRLLLMLAQQLRYLMDRELEADDLTTQQAMLLTIVELLGGAPRLSEAAKALSMTHQNVKQLVTVLERKGFLEVTVDEEDLRARRIRATARSHGYWNGRDQRDRAAIAAAMGALSASELCDSVRLMEKLAHGVALHHRTISGKGP